MLLVGEDIDFSDSKDKEDVSMSIEEINEKYVKGEVRIITEQARYPLKTIVSMLDSGNYQLNPDFQRRRRWDIERKSKLIESFIMNIPVPPIFLYESKFSYYEIMDGLQRVLTIYDFYKDFFKLQGLEIWKEINDFSYSELPEQVKRGIDRRYLSSIILLQETAKDPGQADKMKQLVFERLNSGGVKLEPQETRNALYDGPLNRLCIKLSRNNYLCKMWGIPEQTQEEIEEDIISVELQQNQTYKKMGDVELVLRYFAFRQIDKYDHPTAISEYLDYFLQKGNKFSRELLEVYEVLFNETIEFVYNILEDNAFMLWRKRGNKGIWYDRPTKVLYDPIMYCFTQYLEHKEKIYKHKERIRYDITKLYEDNYDSFEGRNTNKANITKRREIFQNFLSSYVGA